jgi:hypothetical protein
MRITDFKFHFKNIKNEIRGKISLFEFTKKKFRNVNYTKLFHVIRHFYVYGYWIFTIQYDVWDKKRGI